MLQRSAVRSHPGHGHPGYDGLRAQPKIAKPQSPDKTGWTLGHAGRQVRVGPVAFWTIVGSLVLMAGWSAMTATYFAFRDDVLTRLLARQAQMQFAYEDRIAELRGQVDRLAGRQLLDQEQVETRLEQIMRRQALLKIPLVRPVRPAGRGSHRLDQIRAARHANPHRPDKREALADQRYRDPRAAAGTRGAA